MNNPDSVKIIKRFFEALDMLIESKVLRGVQTFTREYKINKRNFYTARKEPERDMFQMAWLSYLVKDFGVSAQWLMTGIGGMFGKREHAFYIDREQLKVQMDVVMSFMNKPCVIAYIPSERERTIKGTMIAIRQENDPSVVIRDEKGAERAISLYKITEIKEIED